MDTGDNDAWMLRQEGGALRRGDARDHGDVDYGRIVHSGSFRRLQGKTQVLGLGDGDFYRTRLTHSIEVGQIAGGLANQLLANIGDHPAAPYLPSRAMIQAIGMTHDLGHPPYGHGGEVALNYCMRDHGGFEGNGQTLGILTKLEKFSASHGSDLTRRTLLGVLKYPVAYGDVANPNLRPRLHEASTTVRILDRNRSKPPKCYLDGERQTVDWILAPLRPNDRDAFTAVLDRSTSDKPRHGEAQHKSLDCSIMDLADDISFGVHDLEDVIALELLSQSDFERHIPEDACAHLIGHLNKVYPNRYGNDVYEGWKRSLFGSGGERKHQINRLVGYFVQAIGIETLDAFEAPLLRYRARLPAGAMQLLDALKAAVREVVIFSPGVQHLEFKGQTMVVAVFEALSSEPEKFLPLDERQRWREGGKNPRTICDHVAGMTDDHLARVYGRLFSPGAGSVFDRL